MEAARLATVDDVASLARLAEQAVAEQVTDRGGAVWAQRETRPLPADDSLRAALADPRQLVVAGTIDDVVIGYGAVRLERLRNDELLAVITDLFVEPEARAVGVGEAVVTMILDWAGAQGCMGVDALALPGNRDTKNFFETFGFTARALVVHRRLVPAADGVSG